MARRAIGVNDAPADSAPIGSGPTRWAALAEVPRAHEVVDGWPQVGGEVPSPKLGSGSYKKDDRIGGALTE